MVSQSRRAEFRRRSIQFGLCYIHGDGVAKDWVEAYKWLLLAARQGDEDAKKNITELESKLTAGADCGGTKAGARF